MNYNFPVDTCVVACSGPSLNKVDPYSLGLPVCAISTAIRSIQQPNYWFIADYLNEMHGEEGRNAWNDANVVKVVPNKTLKTPGNNVIQHPYNEGREANRYYETLLFDPTKPLLRGPHKTLTFAIQWLHVCGVKNIIFAGNDLEANSFDTKYSYSLKEYDRKKQHNFKKTLDQIKEALQKWYPVAQSKGFNWYSWECGPVFESFVPKYDSTVEVKKNYNGPEIIYSKSVQDIVQEVQRKEELSNLSERDRNRKEYNRLMSQTRSNKPEKSKVNMGLYFDLLHKRKK